MIRTDIDWSAKPAPWCYIGPAYRAECKEIARGKIWRPRRPDVDQTGEDLRKRRRAVGMTQEELGVRARVSNTLISQLECGTNSASAEAWGRIDDALVTVDGLAHRE